MQEAIQFTTNCVLVKLGGVQNCACFIVNLFSLFLYFFFFGFQARELGKSCPL